MDESGSEVLSCVEAANCVIFYRSERKENIEEAQASFAEGWTAVVLVTTSLLRARPHQFETRALHKGGLMFLSKTSV